MVSFRAVLLNGTRKNQSLDKEMMQVDLTNDLQNIEVPYIMIQLFLVDSHWYIV